MRAYYGRTIFPSLLLFSLLTLPAAATQIWAGAGRITQGLGQGGSVRLQLEMDGDGVTDGVSVKTLHGPPLNGKIQTGAIQNNFGAWRFKPCAQDLCVTLTRAKPRQTIVYRLYRSDRERTK